MNPDTPAGEAPIALRKTLGFWQVALYGTGSMLGAGIYALIGKAAGTLGNAVWLAFVVAMIAAMLTGLSYACVGSRYPRAGGASYVTHRAFNRAWLSYVVGIAVMMSGLTSMATGSQAIAENLIEGFSLTIDSKVIAIIIVFGIGCVIFRGIRESMMANILCTVVEASGLLFIIAVGMKFWGSVDYLEMPHTSENNLSQLFVANIILQGAVLTFFSFIGFEDVLNIGEEVKDAPRDLPRGLIAAMLFSTAIYLMVAITAVSVVPWRELAESTTPLMDVAARAAPWFHNIEGVFLVITIFAIGNTALLNYLMGSRLLYGMSRQRLLPEVLGRLHPKRHTPHFAIVVLFVIVTLLILTGGVKQLAESTVLLLLCVFTVVNISLVLLKLRPNEPRGKFEVPLFVPILGACVCVALIIARVANGFHRNDPTAQVAPLVSGAILVCAYGLYVVLKPRKVVVEEE